MIHFVCSSLATVLSNKLSLKTYQDFDLVLHDLQVCKSDNDVQDAVEEPEHVVDVVQVVVECLFVLPKANAVEV